MEPIKTSLHASPVTAVGRLLLSASLVLGAGVAFPSPAHAGDRSPQWIASRYTEALDAFHRRRFPEAYGSFIAIAEAGYAPAARQALWMCENGQALLARQFDCGPDDIEHWALLAGTNAREALERIHPGYATGHGLGAISMRR